MKSIVKKALKIDIKYSKDLLREHGVPAFATKGSAAIDLRANITHKLALNPKQKADIPTGLFVDLRDNPEIACFVLPRSGKGGDGLVLRNSTGLIDSDYQGEIMLKVINNNELFKRITIQPGEKIFQMVFIEGIVRPAFNIVEEFGAANDPEMDERGTGGFGSTDKSEKT